MWILMQSLHQNLRSVPLKSVGGRGFVVPPPPPTTRWWQKIKERLKWSKLMQFCASSDCHLLLYICSYYFGIFTFFVTYLLTFNFITQNVQQHGRFHPQTVQHLSVGYVFYCSSAPFIAMEQSYSTRSNPQVVQFLVKSSNVFLNLYNPIHLKWEV